MYSERVIAGPAEKTQVHKFIHGSFAPFPFTIASIDTNANNNYKSEGSIATYSPISDSP